MASSRMRQSHVSEHEPRHVHWLTYTANRMVRLLSPACRGLGYPASRITLRGGEAPGVPSAWAPRPNFSSDAERPDRGKLPPDMGHGGPLTGRTEPVEQRGDHRAQTGFGHLAVVRRDLIEARERLEGSVEEPILVIGLDQRMTRVTRSPVADRRDALYRERDGGVSPRDRWGRAEVADWRHALTPRLSRGCLPPRRRRSSEACAPCPPTPGTGGTPRNCARNLGRSGRTGRSWPDQGLSRRL